MHELLIVVICSVKGVQRSTAEYQRLLQVWDLRSKRSVQTLTDNFQILSVCFGDAGDQVYTAGLDNTVKVSMLHNTVLSCNTIS